MSTLLDDIIREAQDDAQSLPNVLRKCLILASELKNARLKDWADRELSGYVHATEVPSYRTVPASAYGHFVGWNHSEYVRHLIPSVALPETLRHWGEKINVTQSVGSLHDLAKADLKRGTITFDWPPNMVAVYQDKLMEGYMCHNAWQEMPKSALIEILETVRNITLRMALEIREEVGGKSDVDFSRIQPSAVERIQHVVINNVGNVGLGDMDASNQTIIIAGNRKTLDTALTKAGLDQFDLGELTNAIQADGGTNVDRPGTKLDGWIKSKAGKIVIGGVKVGVSIGQQILTDWLLIHAGLKKP